EGRQSLQRPLGLSKGSYLQPMAEQHDRDQGRELRPEVDVEETQAGGEGASEGHDEAHRDEQHHPGTPAASLRPAAREETTPAVEEHGGAEHRPYKVAS